MTHRPRFKVKTVDKPPYVIDPSKLQRFNSKNTIFGRIRWDPSWDGFWKKHITEERGTGRDAKTEYSPIDFALAHASRAVQRVLRRGYRRNRLEPFSRDVPRNRLGLAEENWHAKRIKVDDLHEMSKRLKYAARLFGASLVGVTKLNKNWVYADAYVPDNLENVIVMAIEMDADAIATSPSPLASAATGVGYSKMDFVLTCMGQFIRNLGYEAMPCGNDTALSIPLAIDAGLGELGRNGLLIASEFGPRVRLCKVFTDLPLETDKPIEFGIKKFCEKCKLCAEACEVGAISTSEKPSYEIACRSNNPGALKWYVNVEKCFMFWRKNGTSCSTCIKVCPFNRSGLE